VTLEIVKSQNAILGWVSNSEKIIKALEAINEK